MYRKQNSIKKKTSFSGLGVHTGEEVSMCFCPAEEGTGIVFKRIDLPEQPIIPATLQYVCDTQRSTTLGIGNIRIHTVEHVLAALYAAQIDNVCIEVSNVEPPIGDGSSAIFSRMIQEVGIQEQKATVEIKKLKTPVYWSDKHIHMVALPHDGYKVSYTLNYPNSKILQAQYCSLAIDNETFIKEIAPCRTFSLYEEVAFLMDRGLIKGGSLDNAVVIKGDVVLSKEGLRYQDEMVRHKVLDVIGDFSLIGMPFHAHIIALRGGHASNNQLANLVLANL